MQRTLADHITRLEQKIESLKRQLTEPGNWADAQKSSLRIDLGIAERALVHFRKAYDLERKISD